MWLVCKENKCWGSSLKPENQKLRIRYVDEFGSRFGQYSLKKFLGKRYSTPSPIRVLPNLLAVLITINLTKFKLYHCIIWKSFKQMWKKTERVFTITKIKLSAQSSKDSKSPNRQLCLVRSQPRVILIATLQLRWITDFELDHNLPR